MQTKRHARTMIDLARGERAEAPQETINRLRYAFPDLPEKHLRAMALRHPEVMRAIRSQTRLIERHKHTLNTGA